MKNYFVVYQVNINNYIKSIGFIVFIFYISIVKVL